MLHEVPVGGSGRPGRGNKDKTGAPLIKELEVLLSALPMCYRAYDAHYLDVPGHD